MLRTIVALAIAVLVLAACGATDPPTELATDAGVRATSSGRAESFQPWPELTTTTAPPPPPTTTTVPAPEPSTTTTMPPSPPAPAVAPAATGGCPAGGDPGVGACWDLLAGCESGGDWAANTGNGYYGGVQFALSSWRGVGGTGYPHQHSRAEQVHRGQLLHAQGGWQHWPACSRQLGWL